jgi:hypothetical protein
MASRDAEESVYRAAKDGLKRWLGRAREVVMSPWKSFQAVPDPTAIYATVPLWQAQVDKILEALTPALREGWAAAHLPGEYDPNDPYIQANLAMTNNLLVRIPDETHAKIVKEIFEGTNAGESTAQIAERVDSVLTYTGSENWDGRARLIAITETTRNRNASALAHGLLVQKNGNDSLVKEWLTTMDGKERTAHREVNHDLKSLGQPFIVGGVEMLYPGDPTAPPDLVCNCRCDLIIRKA